MGLSTNYTFGLAVSQLQDTQTQLTKTQGQLATGKLYVNPSDNPAVAATVQRVQDAIDRQDSFAASLTQVDNRLAGQETAVTSVATLLTRMKSLPLQAASDTSSAQDRANINIEIKTLHDQLLSLANTQDANGNFIFGGAVQSRPPFASDAGGQVTYVGDQASLYVPAEAQLRLTAGLSGDAVFAAVPRTADGKTSGIGFFRVIDDLSGAIGAGDTAGMQQGIAELGTLQDGISHAIASIGANRSAVTQQQQVVSDTKTRLQSALSGAQDTDYTVVATRLQQQMLALQAGQASFAQSSRLNLFDYLK